MDEESSERAPERQDGSQPERGTGQRQDHRAAPPGHKIPGEAANLDDPEPNPASSAGETAGEDADSED